MLRPQKSDYITTTYLLSHWHKHTLVTQNHKHSNHCTIPFALLELGILVFAFTLGGKPPCRGKSKKQSNDFWDTSHREEDNKPKNHPFKFLITNMSIKLHLLKQNGLMELDKKGIRFLKSCLLRICPKWFWESHSLKVQKYHNNCIQELTENTRSTPCVCYPDSIFRSENSGVSC